MLFLLGKFDEYRKKEVELLLVYGKVQLFLIGEIMTKFRDIFDIRFSSVANREIGL